MGSVLSAQQSNLLRTHLAPEWIRAGRANDEGCVDGDPGYGHIRRVA
jgi:hypothetical protein